MPNRFYLANLPESGVAVLEDLEAHHLIHVLRASPGDIVELFNGTGLVASAQIISVHKRDAKLQILGSHRDAPSKRQLIVATAVPKGDRFDWLIEKATELGVTRIIPLRTTRSVVDPRDSKLEKQRQTVIAACKQSGRNHLLELSPTMTWSDFASNELGQAASYIAHPGPSARLASPLLWQDKATIVFAVGPEGGFTQDEVDLAITRGAAPISLGPRILRIETAVLALAACAGAC